MTQNIFSEFPPSDKTAWKNQAIRDLRGKDFDKSLNSLLWDKIVIEPFYSKEDVMGLPKLPQSCFEKPSALTGFSPRAWANMVSVYPETTNEEILSSLQNGASGLILHLTGDENLEEQLKGVIPDYISILVKPKGNPVLVLEVFLNWARKVISTESDLKGAFLWSPADLLFEENESWEAALMVFREVFEAAKDLMNFHPVTIQFSRYAEAGATDLDELVFGFGELIDLIAHAGLEPEAVWRKVTFYSAVGESHFPEIAKLKALRFFASQLAFQYGVTLEPEDVQIFAQTSDWTKSSLDAHTNLIRQTYEAMAAVFGGVNGLLVKPFPDRNSGNLELRIARNVSSIFVHESYLDKVIDPAAGSYYLDSLVFQILEKVREGLQNLEEKGGWLAAFNSQELHEKVRESRQKQQNAVLSGQISKIGVNKYVAPEMVKHDLEFSPIHEKAHELKPSRAAYLVELQNQTKA